jgi:hypothetical protein
VEMIKDKLAINTINHIKQQTIINLHIDSQ